MIYVGLTVKELRDAGACESGIEQFLKVLPDGLISTIWTPLHAVWASVLFKSNYQWAIETGLIPRIHATRANLQGADLRNADLRGAYLQGANLRNAYLRNANLRNANLQNAELQGALK